MFLASTSGVTPSRCGRSVDWSGVVAAASAPFTGGSPELVVQQPLTGPRQDGLCYSISRGPLVGLMQAEAAVRIDVGEVAVGIVDELRATHEDAGVIRWRVAEIYLVLPADLTGLELTGPSQDSSFERRLSMRVVIFEQSDFPNEFEGASIGLGHEICGVESWCRPFGSLFPAGRRRGRRPLPGTRGPSQLALLPLAPGRCRMRCQAT